MSTLVIIESPGKRKKLESILGAQFTVCASFGHVRDLPRNRLGVDIGSYSPEYVVGDERAEAAISKLRAAASKASRVLLATDPDREGEAIAWHVADTLKLRNPMRVAFSEITPTAVRAAIDAPRPLDMALVRAQEARRVLDRLVGYQASPALSNRAGHALSAGRVQSPAVRLVTERERAIRSFVATHHFGVRLHFGTWHADWLPDRPESDPYVTDRGDAERVAATRAVTVVEFADSTARRAPPPPFTTSTLQQRAHIELKLKPKDTMAIAQRLYELGAITYMRTDSPNLSDEACAAIAEYAREQRLPLSTEHRRWKAKGNAQEAHEAIRPTHIDHLDAGESDAERALYRLIWTRAVASQLADAEYAVRTATLASSSGARFRARGRCLTAAGWTSLHAGNADALADADDNSADDAEAANPIPVLSVDDSLSVDRADIIAKQTKPLPRYTLATLVRELEAHGIGRPATYASILDNIQKREYITEDRKGRLAATPLGEALIDSLVNTCTFVDLDYTAELENKLDAIATGQATYIDVVREANDRLCAELARISTVALAHPCPTCGQPLRRIRCAKDKDPKGKGYDFWGCTGYPACKASFQTAPNGTPLLQPKQDPSHAKPKPKLNRPGRRSRLY